MATIFRDEFTGTGSINGHMPDIGVPDAAWSDADPAPTAQLAGGYLVAPEVGVTRVVSYDYRPAGTLLPIDFPVQGTYSLTFRTGTSSEIAFDSGGDNRLFLWSIKTDDAGNTTDLNLSATGTPGQFLLQGTNAAAFVALEPETTYVLTWVYETTLDRFEVSTTPPTTFQGAPSGRPAAAPYGFAFLLTEKTDFDELQVTDTVPPPPVEPTDFLFDDFTGDGPMEGRTPDFVAIPDVTWTDTTPTGSAETLNGNMVTGPGVPPDSYASARYGEFATPYYGPLTGDVYAGFLTGPDLSYPVGASGPVVIVELRFSQSPSTFAVFRLVVNPDGSFTATLGDDSELTVLLLPDTEYDVYINYLETEHYISVFDLTNSVSLIDTTYLYTPAMPNTGYGATELLVSERASMTYYEVYGLPQQQIVNDTDGMDDGVAEDAADTLNLATEDVVEAGVGEDYPLLDGEVLPEDVREAGIGADMAENQLDAMQDVMDAGVGADASPSNVNSTFFVDEFVGAGSIAGHVPNLGFGPVAWAGNSLLSSGLLKFDPSQLLFTEATYGSDSTNYGTSNTGQIDLKFITRNIPTGQDVAVLQFRFSVRGRSIGLSLQRLASGLGRIQIDGVAVIDAPAQVLSNSVYNGCIQYGDAGIFVTGFGGSLRVLWNETSPVGLNQLRFFNYASADIERIEVKRTQAANLFEDAYASGFGADTATPFLKADVVEAAVVEDIPDPVGGVRLFVDDGDSTGVTDDATNIAITRNANGRATGVAADFAPNDYYALPRTDGVAADAATPFLNARQIVMDTGIAAATTDTRILQDVVEAAVADDATTTASFVLARSAGVADDRAPASTTVNRTVVEAAVVNDIAVGTPAYLENTVAMSTGVAADDAPNAAGALARDTGVGVARALPSYTATQNVVEAAVGVGMASFSIQVDVVEEAVAADAVSVRILLGEFVREAGVAEDATRTARATRALALSTGVATDATSRRLVANTTAIDAGVGDDAALFAMLYEAWVMNTQTTAMSRYSGLPFRSAAMVNGRLIGLGDTGFFELSGSADDGVPVKAKMTTGFLRLGSDATKRLDDITLGYVSDSTVKFGVTAYGPIKATYSYASAPRPAKHPRGTRVKPGKGLSSKYYQFSIENTPGAKVLFDYASVDVAASTTRRI